MATPTPPDMGLSPPVITLGFIRALATQGHMFDPQDLPGNRGP